MNPTYKEPIVFDGLDLEGTATRALVSIANSLAILADETKDVSPIVAAALFVRDVEVPFENDELPPIDRSKS